MKGTEWSDKNILINRESSWMSSNNKKYLQNYGNLMMYKLNYTHCQ